MTKMQRKSKKNEVVELSSRVDDAGRPQWLPKRTKCPGVRVIGGRIYDSELGKTCHQCRQKTRDFMASCKNRENEKICPIKFCHKCLQNRYGEKAEEMDVLNAWKCPKCRGICNCSVCMKRRGHKPTGILVLRAKASGFSSVSEMLTVKATENLSHNRTLNENIVSPKKIAPLKKEPVVVSPRKRGKENYFDGNNDLNSQAHNLTRNLDEIKQKRKKQEGEKKMHNGIIDDNALLEKKNPKKPRLSIEASKKEVNADGNGCDENEEEKKGAIRTDAEVSVSMKNDDSVMPKAPSDPIEKEKCEKDNTFFKNVEILDRADIDDAGVKPEKLVNYNKIKNHKEKIANADFEFGIPLPQSADLTVVAGIELPADDVGDALQFLEFCAAFGKILDVKKGQPESILRELNHGRSGRPAKYSSTVQFHIQLLSLILKDSGEESPSLSLANGKNYWLQALGKCVSESQCALKELPLDCFDRGTNGYDKLDFSRKLKLLNFLCDETLGTADMRAWIEDQNKKFIAKKKEAKGKVLAARKKKKCIKQKLQDEVAKAIIAKNGALSISEHEAIVSQIKKETDQAHAEFLEAMEVEPIKKQISGAVRTDPIVLGDNGWVYWRLEGYSREPEILLQEVSSWDAVIPREKWSVYTVEQREVIEKYISFLREKKHRLKKVSHTLAPPGSETGQA
ncbi:uncharacterized protein LOC131160792 isoform X2 [Malania oleifera]|uniref:uncharacterized protein LOC131160792 isoform X2 n=1 Tax=Malania oleifera TaxID=397392 RepID=UPI0025AE2AA9|nr:uncharacterized protein LOC131160792 isoform X2 [Malania oleifera]